MSPSHLPPSLVHAFKDIHRLAVAFSGGLDSRFLAFAARSCGIEVRLYHARGPHLNPADSDYARQWASDNAFPLEIIAYNPLRFSEVAHNTRQRCYACKAGLIRELRKRLRDLDGQWILGDGTQADDLTAHRPGNLAISEGGVFSPLAKAGMTKARIRQTAAELGLDNPGQKARPCLLTRLDYGLAPDDETLQRVAQCEKELADMLPALVDFRLRLTPGPILQTTAPLDTLKPKAMRILAENGFKDARFLVSATVSGFFDQGCHKRPAV